MADAALPLLSGLALKIAAATLKAWAKLPPDPLGTVWGHFDAHGWDMAFNPATQRLNGIYDFGDSGFGPLHQDLIYSALISPDLTHCLARAYAARTGLPIDHNRLETLIGAHRLWELAKGSPADHPWLIAAVETWATKPKGTA